GIPVTEISAYTGSIDLKKDLLESKHQPVVSVGVVADQGAIPLHFGENRLLQSFRYRHGLQKTRPDVGLVDEEPPLGWEREIRFTIPDELALELPLSLYAYEMVQCAQAVVREVAHRGFKVAPACTALFAFVAHDSHYYLSDGESLRKQVVEQIQEHLQ